MSSLDRYIDNFTFFFLLLSPASGSESDYTNCRRAYDITAFAVVPCAPSPRLRLPVHAEKNLPLLSDVKDVEI